MSNNPFLPNSNPVNDSPLPMPGTFVGAGTGAGDNFEVDLTDVQESQFIIPDGYYRVKCTEIEQNVSKSGNPMFVWTFEISEGEHKGFQGKAFTAITPAAMWKVAETVIALGVGQTGSVVKFKRTDVIGKECGAFIEKTEYNGKENSQISKVISLKELAESRS